MEILMDNRQLLIDVMTFDVRPEVIREALNRTGKVLVQGVIQRADSLNQNKRVYPKKILMREVQKYMELVTERRSLGELDHPESSVINLANVSHLITELHWEGDDLLGTVEVLGTPAGNILASLFNAGVRVGISSRGLGSVNEIGNGAVEVQEDFEILCWDMVSNPSTQGSFMVPVAESVLSEGIIVNKHVSNKNFNRLNEIILDIFSNLDYDCGVKCELPPTIGRK
jgi:hypothetical protein